MLLKLMKSYINYYNKHLIYFPDVRKLSEHANNAEVANFATQTRKQNLIHNY